MLHPVDAAPPLHDRRTIHWLTRVLGPGTMLYAAHPLPGATSSNLYHIEAENRYERIDLVLRQFVNADWLAHEPDLARHEAQSLQLARATGLPTPYLIAFDETGAESGVPSVLMSRLPGSVDLHPADFDGWLDCLAETLARIHALEMPEYPWAYGTYQDVSQLKPPTWSEVPRLWEQTIAYVQQPPPPSRNCFIHRDFHPVNVLWHHDQISGVVDWVNACRGAPGVDVGHCRLNLAACFGVDAAERFLRAYQRYSGDGFTYHPYWDLVTLIEILPGPPTVYRGWTDFGLHHLTPELLQQRLDQYLHRVLQQV